MIRHYICDKTCKHWKPNCTVGGEETIQNMPNLRASLTCKLMIIFSFLCVTARHAAVHDLKCYSLNDECSTR